MRRRAISLMICAVLMALSICVGTASNGISHNMVVPEGFRAVARNDKLMLLVSDATSEIAICDLRTGDIWRSSPEDMSEAEGLSRGAGPERLRSQFSISYFTSENQRQYMNNYTDSIAMGQFDIEPIKNGVRIKYVLGPEWSDYDRIPLIISKNRMDSMIVQNLEEDDDKVFFLSNYMLVQLRPAGQGEQVQISGLDTEKLFAGNVVEVLDDMASDERDPISDDEALATIMEELADHRRDIVKKKREVGVRREISDLKKIRHADIAQMVGNPTYILRENLTNWDKEDMAELLKEVGYTPDDASADHRENHYDPPQPNPMTYTVPVEYTLDGENLVVRIPCSKVTYPKDVENAKGKKVRCPIESIELLEFFGAAGSDAQGYIFIPDGSGALIRLNSGKSYASRVDLYVYGIDQALEPIKEKPLSLPQATMPVYGIVNGSKALFAVIEDGDTLARIRADVAGRTSSYNCVWPSFTVIPKAAVNLSGDLSNASDKLVADLKDRTVNLYQARQYMGDIKVRYSFLYGSDASYVGMAHTYQDYLVQYKGLTRLEPSSSIPFFLEMIGAARTKASIMGVPRMVTRPLTTFSQVDEVTTELKDAGVDNISLRLTGWLTGGLEHGYPSRASVERALGGQAGLEKLALDLNEKGVKLYPDVAFMTVYRNSMFDGFTASRDGARFLTRKTAQVWDYNAATAQREWSTQKWLLSPSKLPRLVGSFKKSYDRLGIDRLCLRDLGSELHADYRERPDQLVDRQEAKSIVESQMKNLSADCDIMTSGGFAYALPYSKQLINVPLDAGDGSIIDESVPFLQIALHGYAHFAGEPINMAQDMERAALKTVESGACPYFQWTYADSSALVGTAFNTLYSVGYKTWFDWAVDFYDRSNQALFGLDAERIIDHVKLSEGVYKTVFESGRYVIVNYTSKSFEGVSFQVPAQGFIAGR